MQCKYLATDISLIISIIYSKSSKFAVGEIDHNEVLRPSN